MMYDSKNSVKWLLLIVIAVVGCFCLNKIISVSTTKGEKKESELNGTITEVAEQAVNSLDNDNPYYNMAGLVGGNMDGDNNDYPTCFTYEQIITNMDACNVNEVIAIKKGDLFYTVDFLSATKYKMYANYGFLDFNVNGERFDEFRIGYDKYRLPTVDLKEGDQIVYIAGEGSFLNVSVYKVILSYDCVPMCIEATYNQNSGDIMNFDCSDIWFENKIAPDYSVDEINGDSNFTNIPFVAIGGDSDKAWGVINASVYGGGTKTFTLGGYKNTNYIETTIEGTALMLRIEMEEREHPNPPFGVRRFIYSPKEYLRFYQEEQDLPQKTKNGYFILVDEQVNKLEAGRYLLGSKLITIDGATINYPEELAEYFEKVDDEKSAVIVRGNELYTVHKYSGSRYILGHYEYDEENKFIADNCYNTIFFSNSRDCEEQVVYIEEEFGREAIIEYGDLFVKYTNNRLARNYTDVNEYLLEVAKIGFTIIYE